MSLELCILASGSAGNCSVVRTPGGVMLVDVGIGPRTAAARLSGTGVAVADISAICLTHLDRDHFNGNWAQTIARQKIRVFCHAGRIESLCAIAGHVAGFESLIQSFDRSPFQPIEGLTAKPLHLKHDREGSHGFAFEGFGERLGYATDLGQVPRVLIDQFAGVDLLAIESNYDPQMQQDSPRPQFLKRRITGGSGHLSNQQAFDAVREILSRAEQPGNHLPSHIVLLHRSRQCNCPKLLRSLFSQDRRIAPRLVLADQYQRTEWLRPTGLAPQRGEQLALAWD